MNFPSKRSLVIVIIALCILSRLPQLLSSNLVLDGDECVVGLMAKHIFSLRDFPLFFYGQAYGFSLIECLAIVPFYAVAGISTISVKLAMLCLWTIGVVFMFKTFLKINTGSVLLPLLLILIFICCPAWGVWSLKARGGYLTAFMLSSILLYLLFSPEAKFAVARYFVIGILFTLIYQCQPLWIPGLIPLLIYPLYAGKYIRNIIAFIIPVVILFILFYFYKQGISHYYTPDYSYNSSLLITYVQRIPYFLFSSLHGYYFSTQIQKPNFYAAFFAYLFTAIIFFLPAAALYNIVKRKRGTTLFNLSALSVLLTLCCTLFFKEVHPRYLLPVTGYSLLALQLFLQTRVIGKKICYIASPVLITTGIISLVFFKDFRFSTMQKNNLGQLITYLQYNNTHYVYCYDYMLTCQLIFYSKEQVIARDRPLPGRYPSYSQQVDSALNNGVKTAFIFNELQLRNMPLKDITKFKGYLIVFDPTKNELEKIFQF